MAQYLTTLDLYMVDFRDTDSGETNISDIFVPYRLLLVICIDQCPQVERNGSWGGLRTLY